jgi:hypothetical protein
MPVRTIYLLGDSTSSYVFYAITIHFNKVFLLKEVKQFISPKKRAINDLIILGNKRDSFNRTMTARLLISVKKIDFYEKNIFMRLNC